MKCTPETFRLTTRKECSKQTLILQQSATTLDYALPQVAQALQQENTQQTNNNNKLPSVKKK